MKVEVGISVLVWVPLEVDKNELVANVGLEDGLLSSNYAVELQKRAKKQFAETEQTGLMEIRNSVPVIIDGETGLTIFEV